MKFGDSGPAVSYDGNSREEKIFRYWVLPDKPMHKLFSVGPEWDIDATQRQTEQIKEYLGKTLEPRTWTEANNRFYFVNKEDWEMFQTMCLLGWQ